MIEIRVKDSRTGKVRTFVARTALVLLREDDEDVTVCVSGQEEENQEALCGMLEDAHECVSSQVDTELFH